MIGQAEALTLIKREMASLGYQPQKFALDLSAKQNAPYAESWTFVYGCKPVQTEGCFLIATIDRSSKTVDIFAGEAAKK